MSPLEKYRVPVLRVVEPVKKLWLRAVAVWLRGTVVAK